MVPIGTGFFVGVPTKRRPDGVHWYLATAAHVVAHTPDVHVRIRGAEGLIDLPVNPWFRAQDARVDLAVAPFMPPPGADHLHYPLTDFLSDAHEAPYLGDPVYFVGLLGFVPSMGLHNVPMVRSGTLGALDQPGVPVRFPGNIRGEVTAHLIDCRSYRGFSGAPCFVQHPGNGTTRLLGVISAHFDAATEVPLQGDRLEGASATVPIHAGVGVVTPARYLAELLAHEPLAARREAAEARAAR